MPRSRYFRINSRHFIEGNYSCASNAFYTDAECGEYHGHYGGSVFIRGPMDETVEPADQRSILTAHLANRGTLASSLPEGYAYVGEYTATHNNRYMTDSSGEVIRAADPTGLAALIRACSSPPYTGYRINWTYTAGYPLEASWIPLGPEILGSPLPTGTTTVKTYSENDSWRSCGNCGRVGHDMRTCAHPPKAHDRIGVELEGRWRNLDSVVRRARDAGLTASSDGSVERGNGDARPYEIQTRPGTLASVLNNVAEYYPDEADASCGMHVHVSFAHPTDFTCLSSTEFFDYFKRRWTEWGTAKNLNPNGQFFRRLNGQNDYCYVNSDTPADLRNIDRYHQLNFSAWHEHKTVECRLLPMFTNQALAIDAIKELIDIYETFLANPAEFGLVLPAANAAVEANMQPAQRLSATCDTPQGFKETLRREIEMEDIAPPAPGMMRVAVPGGKFDFAMLQKIANMQKKAA